MSKMSLRRSAGEIKKYIIIKKAASALCILLSVVVATTYLASFLYDQFGSFTVNINKYDMVKQGLTLSETPEFESPMARLNAKAAKDITNISGDRIPPDVDNINGEHNGDDYTAFTFYLKNMGEDTVTYKYMINIGNATQGVDKAIRFKLFRNGEAITYARTRSDGTGAEPGTFEFVTESIVADQKITAFKKGDVDKYTVVIWLEGDDPDCVDSIIGGSIKMDMQFEIVEN